MFFLYVLVEFIANGFNQLPFRTIETSNQIEAGYFPGASIFIDYNSDGDFEDLGESYYTNVASKYRYHDVAINVPINSVPGKTRLRIVQRDQGPYSGPCTSANDILGSTVLLRDYIITIEQAPDCNLFYNDTIIAPSCASYSNGGLSINPKGGTAPYHLQWNTGNPKDTLFTLSGLASPGRQRATITDATGCNVRTSMLQITQPALLHIDTMLHSSPAWIAFSGGTRPYHASITGDKTETRYAVNDTIFLTDLPVGNYHIKATDSNGCDMQEYMLTHTALDIVIADAENAFILYPNPATNYIQISGIVTNALITIYSMDGRKVFEGNATNQLLIPLLDLSAALYFVKVEEENRRNTFKLIVK